MLKQELTRLIKSKMSIIIFILLLISAIDFFMTYNEKLMFIGQLENDLSPDLNRTALAQLIANYTGFKFIFNYWFNSDFSQVGLYVLYMWAGIFLSPTLLAQKENGFGSLLCIRKGYKSTALSIFGAQSLYILIIVSVTTLLQVLLAFIIGGFGTYASIGIYELNLGAVFLIIIVQILIFSLFTVFANGVAMFCGSILKNKYLLQVLPLMGFAVVPLLASATLGKASTALGKILFNFESNGITHLVSNIANSTDKGNTLLYGLIPIVVYAVLLAILALNDIRKNSKNYI